MKIERNLKTYLSKWFVIFFALILSIVVLNGCTNKDAANENNAEAVEENNNDHIQEKENDRNNQLEENKKSEESESNSKETESKNEDSIQNKESTSLLNYRPEAGITKVFLEDEEFEVTHEIIATNDQLEQRLVSLGQSKTMQILEYTEDTIFIVWEEQNPSDVSDKLENFQSYNPPELLIDLNQEGSGEGDHWEVIGVEDNVEVPYGTFNNVYVVRKTLESETSSTKAVIEVYYAPEIGVIKEITDFVGEVTESVLTEVR